MDLPNAKETAIPPITLRIITRIMVFLIASIGQVNSLRVPEAIRYCKELVGCEGINMVHSTWQTYMCQ
jgi:hypothetical protein